MNNNNALREKLWQIFLNGGNGNMSGYGPVAPTALNLANTHALIEDVIKGISPTADKDVIFFDPQKTDKHKIQFIKLCREVTGIGLADGKKLVESGRLDGVYRRKSIMDFLQGLNALNDIPF